MAVLKHFRTAGFQFISVPGIVLLAATPALAKSYLTLEQAQQAIFPGQTLTPFPFVLSSEQQAVLEEKSGTRGYFKEQRIWRVEGGGFFIVDEVIGKHEFITYALGINRDGSIRQIEIMDYREAYGYQIRQKRWRRQFLGKTDADALKLNEDIKNISGATLSCRHVTEGVKRNLVLYELYLKQ